jgi:hypothetical protein
MTEAESRAVLNTLTERVFQEEFKKLQKRWERESQQTFRLNKSPPPSKSKNKLSMILA